MTTNDFYNKEIPCYFELRYQCNEDKNITHHRSRVLQDKTSGTFVSSGANMPKYKYDLFIEIRSYQMVTNDFQNEGITTCNKNKIAKSVTRLITGGTAPLR